MSPRHLHQRKRFPARTPILLLAVLIVLAGAAASIYSILHP
jgi:hypothetical protein